MTGRPTNAKWTALKIGLLALLVVGAILGYVAWDRGFREHPQPAWVMRDDATRFMYGSIGAERDAGIPYWIFLVLPRMFPEKLPGNGGYASLGVPWEQGFDLPVGFTKKVIGFPRVANNCAVCHTTRYRTSPDAQPIFVPLGPGQTSNVEGFLRFLTDCAKDPRFNADNILIQIGLNTKLDLIDTLLYRFFIIPITKQRLLERERQFKWVYNDAYPEWGRGRDDAMNLTKYFMIKVDPADDGTFGPTDMPSIWNLAKYDNKEGEANPAAHESRRRLVGCVVRSSWIRPWDFSVRHRTTRTRSSRTCSGSRPTQSALRRPAFPKEFPLDQTKATAGKAIFDRQCASCHAEDSPKVGRPLPLADVGTNRDRLDTWGKQYAVKANKVVSDMGIERRGLVEQDLIGYNVPHLDGIWLRAPYLHNGSVPTLRDLLRRPAERPKTFYRGYDVYDPGDVGFISRGDEAKRVGTLHDTSRKGNGNEGHEFGTSLPDEEKNSLIEYLKTL